MSFREGDWVRTPFGLGRIAAAWRDVATGERRYRVTVAGMGTALVRGVQPGEPYPPDVVAVGRRWAFEGR